MKNRLTDDELYTLINSVFKPQKNDTTIAIITDVPNERRPDHGKWQERREIVYEWYSQLLNLQARFGFEKVNLYFYENVESNNANLPPTVYRINNVKEPVHAASLPTTGDPYPLLEVLDYSHIILAPTEYSATAPLKMLGKKFPFRAATMPGFSRAMIPALGLDYEKVHKRVMLLKNRLDDAQSALIRFNADGKTYELYLDLRYRKAHASSGLIREKGTAGNLPSGETYIVPYEGERDGDPSKTEGTLPVRLGDSLLLFHITDNRTHTIEGTGKSAHEQQIFLRKEPAYGNIAELGLGILDSFGISAVGSVLLDEKLGLHIAFGRSEHFGGITGPEAFNDPKNVIHMDYVYVPSLQPNIVIEAMKLRYAQDHEEVIIENSTYRV
jgi:hypothetical protein